MAPMERPPEEVAADAREKAGEAVDADLVLVPYGCWGCELP